VRPGTVCGVREAVEVCRWIDIANKVSIEILVVSFMVEGADRS
jgi:hypothetical protein